LIQRNFLQFLISLSLTGLFVSPVFAQGSASSDESASSEPGIESTKTTKPDKRLFGVLPNYRTVDANIPFSPLTPRQKLSIASHDSFDWPTYLLAGVMTFAMPGKDQVKAYGDGLGGFANRYVRTSADQIIGNMFSEGFMPVLLKQDPRYFRPGTGTFWSRLRSSITQIAIARDDQGRRTFNTSEFLGNAIAVSISNAYSPNLRSWSSSTEKLGLQIGTDAFANVVKEFGPDIKQKLFHRHHNGA
jgi:hypothetical protein